MDIHILLYTVCHLSNTDEVYVVQSTDSPHFTFRSCLVVENHVMNLTVFVLVLMLEELWNYEIIESAKLWQRLHTIHLSTLQLYATF